MITGKKLKELAAQLEDEDGLDKNSVGNLAIIRNGVYVGFVDLNTGAVEYFPLYNWENNNNRS